MTLTADWARQVIRDHDAARPRSQQTDIGVSELGHPCARRLVHKIIGTPRSNPGDPLAAYIGTATHAALAEALLASDAGWQVEVPVEFPPPISLRGNVDAWHAALGIVLDWKVVGDAALRRVKADGPGRQYQWQVHTYAAALRAPITTVAICFVPRSGRLANLHLWSEPYDHEIAEAALRRLEQLRTVAAIGHPALAPAVDSWCSYCPYWQPGATDLRVACPGVPPATRPATIAEHLSGVR